MREEEMPIVEPEKSPPAATTESLLALRRRVPKEPHDLPDGRRVWIYGLMDCEIQQWLADCDRKRQDEGRERIDDPLSDAKLLVRTIRDAEGRPLFTYQHLTQLIELPNFVKAPLIAKATKLSAIGGRADEEILKNYEKMLTSGSSSA